jgi:hypothetical protein
LKTNLLRMVRCIENRFKFVTVCFADQRFCFLIPKIIAQAGHDHESNFEGGTKLQMSPIYDFKL